VHQEFDSQVPQIDAYSGDLNQVWTNLINNAIDALQDGGAVASASPQIWIRTFKELDRVVVEIVDNGPGIPQKVQLRIFEPFFTTKKVGQGTGLGLAICKRIVEGQHKGDLRFESKPGETRFEVRLPHEPYR
jgi:signal transduction histidine kinase